jgi:hypothetical protein
VFRVLLRGVDDHRFVDLLVVIRNQPQGGGIVSGVVSGRELTQQIAILLAARLEFTQQCFALVGELLFSGSVGFEGFNLLEDALD